MRPNRRRERVIIFSRDRKILLRETRNNFAPLLDFLQENACVTFARFDHLSLRWRIQGYVQGARGKKYFRVIGSESVGRIYLASPAEEWKSQLELLPSGQIAGKILHLTS
jgi:hypothetical protein